MLEHKDSQTILNPEPFQAIKDRILNKYRLKRKYLQEMKLKADVEDSLEVERKIILDVYKNKLKEYYVLDKNPQTYDDKPSPKASANF